MRITFIAAAILSTFALLQPAAAQTGNAAIASAPGKVGIAQTVDFSATISAIDKATRTITLKGPKGEEQKVVAGPEVKNFDQLKVGDVVQARFLESLVLELKKGGGLAVAKTETAGGVAAKPGEKPAGAAGRQVTVVGNVTKVDAATQTVTVKGPERTVDLKVRDPEQFKLIAVGDQIQATFTEAVAVAVSPAANPAAKAAPKK
jgi:DNA-binding beta-propeller fold protein YncE